MTTWRAKFSPYASRIIPSAIFGLASMPRAADTINLGPGEPDAALFPAAELNRILSNTLRSSSAARRALQYTVNAGEPQLRQRICDYMRSKDIGCFAENILVTNGAQQALDLLSELFVTPSTTVAAQTPTYPGALGIFNAHGAQILAIEKLRNARQRPTAMIYATPNFHNPTGISLTLEERQELVRLAQDSDAVLIEDDPYETLWFDRPPLPSMLALELRDRTIEEAHTVYVGTFSKSIAPGLRVGWIVAPTAIIEQLTLMKQSEDMQAGTLMQVCIAEAMDFILGQHVESLRKSYRIRRDTMLGALAAHFEGDVRWTTPAGGFFVWLTLPSGLNASTLLQRAAHIGVTYVPGAACSHDGSYANSLRLSYSSVSLERIPEAVRRLAQAVGECTSSSKELLSSATHSS